MAEYAAFQRNHPKEMLEARKMLELKCRLEENVNIIFQSPRDGCLCKEKASAGIGIVSIKKFYELIFKPYLIYSKMRRTKYCMRMAYMKVKNMEKELVSSSKHIKSVEVVLDWLLKDFTDIKRIVSMVAEQIEAMKRFKTDLKECQKEKKHAENLHLDVEVYKLIKSSYRPSLSSSGTNLVSRSSDAFYQI
ncbi:hypothetical protein CEXT_580641 [Caerostris extrusa]|uniref:Uncharacterized protein n=1 Tax=Caerostris extrusa TaxID=172846 RepID=A0AAV4Q8E7_CAEEX|nr:hypothetical protein CEXT_580641 [Caerostris extrusa]